jgi:hypothetical protein
MMLLLNDQERERLGWVDESPPAMAVPPAPPAFPWPWAGPGNGATYGPPRTRNGGVYRKPARHGKPRQHAPEVHDRYAPGGDLRTPRSQRGGRRADRLLRRYVIRRYGRLA